MSAYRSPVVGAAGGLFVFYWSASFIYWLWSNDWYFASEWFWSPADQFKAILTGIAFGAILAGVSVTIKRRLTKIGLQGDRVYGIECNIGPMPMKASPPRKAGDLDLSSMRLPEGVSHWHTKWLKSARKQSAKSGRRGTAYADLATAILQVLAASPATPAGVIKKSVRSDTAFEPIDEETGPEEADEKSEKAGFWDRSWFLSQARRKPPPSPRHPPTKAPHGGHTLLEHSYSVAFTALALSRHWTYESAVDQWNKAERGRKTFRKIGKKNGAYKFNPFDELVPILALAHDLGKLQTFKQKATGEWTVEREDHDSISAQMLMRLPEFWKIPRRERRIALLVLSTYHRDGDLRRHVEHVGYEDRIFALLQLLIQADRKTGLLEAGLTEDDSADDETQDQDREEDWKPAVWKAFCQLMNEANRIAPRHNAYRIGQKNVTSAGKPMIVMNEMSVRKEMERILPRECVRHAQTRFGGDVNGLTALLLETLDHQGVLIKQYGNHSVAPTSAVWFVEFYGRDKEKTEAIARWKYSILVDPRIKFQKLCEAPNADSVPQVKGPTGNRNEHVLFGADGPDTGVEPEVDFDGDDGNEPADPDERKRDADEARGDRAQTTVFTDSMMNSALPEPSPEVANLLQSRRSSLARIKRDRAARLKRGSGFGLSEDGSSQESEKPVQTEPEPLDVRFSRSMRQLSIDAAEGRLMGARQTETGWLIPLLQATKVDAGKILMEAAVVDRLEEGSLAGVSIVQEEEGVLLELRMVVATTQPQEA